MAPSGLSGALRQSGIAHHTAGHNDHDAFLAIEGAAPRVDRSGASYPPECRLSAVKSEARGPRASVTADGSGELTPAIVRNVLRESRIRIAERTARPAAPASDRPMASIPLGRPGRAHRRRRRALTETEAALVCFGALFVACGAMLCVALAVLWFRIGV